MKSRVEEFYLDIRRAARTEQRPVVTTDSDLVDETAISRAIQRAGLWFTPKVVENYSPDDFSVYSGEEQENLRQAVDSFRHAAAEAGAELTSEQFLNGLKLFRQLVLATQTIVRGEWTVSVETLVKQAEDWSGDMGWKTRRLEKRGEESLIGDVTLPQLQFFAEQDLYVLDPVARFVPGATGAFDLSIQPSFEVASIYRDYQGCWYLHLGTTNAASAVERESWSKDSFVRCVAGLRAAI